MADAGGPVLIAGTFSIALTKAAFKKAANALKPVRSNWLFLTERVNLAARCFRTSSTSYSIFGIVKLSHISFGFLGFPDLIASTVLAVLEFVQVWNSVFLAAGLVTVNLLAASCFATAGLVLADLAINAFAAFLGAAIAATS